MPASALPAGSRTREELQRIANEQMRQLSPALAGVHDEYGRYEERETARVNREHSPRLTRDRSREHSWEDSQERSQERAHSPLYNDSQPENQLGMLSDQSQQEEADSTQPADAPATQPLEDPMADYFKPGGEYDQMERAMRFTPPEVAAALPSLDVSGVPTGMPASAISKKKKATRVVQKFLAEKDASRPEAEQDALAHEQARVQLQSRPAETPMAILMLCKYRDGPPNLAIWHKWLKETGRPGSKLYIHGKKFSADEEEHPDLAGQHAPWTVPPEYSDVIGRLPPHLEKETDWGGHTLVGATIRLLRTSVADARAMPSPYSHYALVSSDTVPLKPLHQVGKLEFDEERGMPFPCTEFAGYRDEMNDIQADSMREAIRVTQGDAKLNGNYWTTLSTMPKVYSQWWVMGKEEASMCIQKEEYLYDLALDYDELYDARKGIANPPFNPTRHMAADEIVFTAFLNLYSPRAEKFYSWKIMAEKQVGKHAIPFNTVHQLRNKTSLSEVAYFGRKIAYTLPSWAIVTWRW